MSKAFVIHVHSGYGPTHYDLMLEEAHALATWQLADCPGELATGHRIPARKLNDHRAAYLDYEGPISGGRGQVRRFDKGTYESLGKASDSWQVRLDGQALSGQFELRRVGPSPDEWTLEALGAGR